MKILMVIIRWKGGVGRVAENQKRVFEKLGHEVKVISREDDLKCFTTRDGWRELRRAVDKEGYDILYVQDWSCAIPLLAYKNVFVNFNGVEATHPRLQKIVAMAQRKKLTVISGQLKTIFPNATLAHVGVDLDKFKNLELERKPGTIGFANFPTNDYNYSKIKKAAEETGLEFVEIKMKLSADEMVEFYNKLEYFISLPLVGAGFNMSWVEAMACNVPKIIGNYNGVGKSLDITHVESHSSVSEAIKKAVDNRPYKINEDFNWESQGKLILNLFERNRR